MVSSIDTHIELITTHSELLDKQDNEANRLAFSRPHLEIIGSKLRELNMPFTETKLATTSDLSNPIVLQSLLNTRAGVIYTWVSLTLFSVVVLALITPTIQRPLGKINSAIEQLARDQLEGEILIPGHKNMREISAGLENLRRRLIANDQDQTLFLRHISHEIKTPLTSIKEGSKLLEDEFLGSLNEEQREVTHILVKSSNSLQAAIENLLNYNSAISVRKIKRRNKVNLAELVKRAIEKHLIQIRQKKLWVERELHTIREFVDEEQILTVFENLVSNAVKYSPVGGKVIIRLRKTEDGKSEFCIQDDGIGVSEGQHEAIFDAFFVGKQAVRSPLKGTGLGLSIAKQYVEAHQGTIKVLNSRKGALFQVVLG